MKTFIRAFVVVLALTGAAASARISAEAQTTGKTVISKTSDFPVPTCPPDDPNACGMGPH